MSEEDPFDDIDYILEYVSENLYFDNDKQLEQFLVELVDRIKNNYNCLSSETETESESELEVEVDKDGFHSLK